MSIFSAILHRREDINMKKTMLLNAGVSAIIAQMGHTDTLTIGDCGLPIRGSAQRIDLALRKGVPGFLETLEAVLSELCVERAILANEIRDVSPDMHEQILTLLKDIPVDYISHEELKSRSELSRAVIRTGECTAFANILLISSVTF